MFTELPKLFDRDFAVGYLLPVIVWVGASLGLLDLFGFLADVRRWLEGDLLLGATVVSLLALLGAILLLTVNREILRFLEGYGAYNPLQVLLAWERQRLQAMDERIKVLDEKYQAEQRWSPEDALERNRLMRDRARLFPPADHVLPTPFGNVIRAFEAYPAIMYGVDAIPAWPRLVMLMSKEARAQVDNAKAQMDFWINLAVLSGVLAGEYAAACVWVNQFRHPWLLLAAGFVGWLALARSLSSAISWGNTIRSAFDLYLPELARKLRLPPQTSRAAERELWARVSQAWIYGLPQVLPDPLVATPTPPADPEK